MLQLYLDRTQKEWFQKICREDDVTMSQQVRRLIKQFLSEQGIDPPYPELPNPYVREPRHR
ncbi:hypothetical protein [Reinekea blandensis]